MPTREHIDRRWLRLALLNGMEMSKDPNRRVGAAVVGADGRSVGFGYNGLPRGYPDTAENWARPRKYDIVVHSELNAILNAPFSTIGATMYCSLKPCHRCMAAIVNAGIVRVVWLADDEPYKLQNDDIFRQCIESANIEALEYSLDPFTRSLKSLYLSHEGAVPLDRSSL